MGQVTLTALAKTVGKSRPTISAAIGRGMPAPDAKRRCDLDKCLAWFTAEEQGKHGDDQQTGEGAVAVTTVVAPMRTGGIRT